jgi:hypothetical protein
MEQVTIQVMDMMEGQLYELVHKGTIRYRAWRAATSSASPGTYDAIWSRLLADQVWEGALLRVAQRWEQLADDMRLHEYKYQVATAVWRSTFDKVWDDYQSAVHYSVWKPVRDTVNNHVPNHMFKCISGHRLWLEFKDEVKTIHAVKIAGCVWDKEGG